MKVRYRREFASGKCGIVIRLLVETIASAYVCLIDSLVENMLLPHTPCCVTLQWSTVVGSRTRNQVSPGSNPPLLPFGKLGIFVLSIDAPVDSAV